MRLADLSTTALCWQNQLSLKKPGWRVLSSYSVGEGCIWSLTEADRSYTTILLPEEY